MRFLFSFFFLIFSSAAVSAPQEKISAAYLNSSYDGSYAEQEYRLFGEFQFSSHPQFHNYLGLVNSHRKYDGGPAFNKEAVHFGTTWAPVGHAGYYDFGTQFSNTGAVGAKSSFIFMAHTTRFTNWDLAIGADHATYDTGDVNTYKAQIIYIHNQYLFGHGSWMFEDGGTHYAWRNFVRYTYNDKWAGEVSISGGESREDIGLIDDFFSYGFTVTRSYKNIQLGITAERYEGHVRMGSSWGVIASWLF